MRHLKNVPVSYETLHAMGLSSPSKEDFDGVMRGDIDLARIITEKLKSRECIPQDARLDMWQRVIVQDCIILRYEHPSFEVIRGFAVISTIAEDSFEKALLT
jgi:hypothetical protein